MSAAPSAHDDRGNSVQQHEWQAGMKASDTVALRATRPLPLTRMGFGGAPLGNLYRRISEDDAQGALQAAWGAGIRYFDTAPQSGLGRSDQRFGTALRNWDRRVLTLST